MTKQQNDHQDDLPDNHPMADTGARSTNGGLGARPLPHDHDRPTEEGSGHPLQGDQLGVGSSTEPGNQECVVVDTGSTKMGVGRRQGHEVARAVKAYLCTNFMQ